MGAANASCLSTSGFADVKIYNSMIKTAATTTAIGQYNGTVSQANVYWDIVDSLLINAGDTNYNTVTSGSAFIAKGSRLLKASFMGYSAIYLYGSLTSDSKGVKIVATPGNGVSDGVMVAGLSSIADVPTCRQFDSNTYSLQQDPCAIKLVDCIVRTGIKYNTVWNGAQADGKKFWFGKTFKTNIVGVGAQSFVILDKDGNNLLSQAATGDTSAEVFWGIWQVKTTAPQSNSSETVSNIKAGAANANFTIDYKLPLALYSWSFDKKILSATFAAADTNLDNESSLNPFYLSGVAVADNVTGTLGQAQALTGIAIDANAKTITLSSEHTTQEVYNYIKQWLGVSNNVKHYTAFAFDGSKLSLLNGWTFIGASYINGALVDASGVRAAVNGLDPAALGTTWVLGWIKTVDYNNRQANTAPATWNGWNQSSGTGNSTQITLSASTEYQLFLRVPGYYAPIGPIATIDTAMQAQITLPLVVDVDLTGALLWPQTSAHMTQAAKFAYDYGDQTVEYNNVTGATEYISFLAAYRALELIAKAPTMAYQLVQPLYVNGTKDGFTLPRNNPLKVRMSGASNGSGILQADIAYADNQQKAFDRFLANPQNVGNYLLIPQVTASISSSTVTDIRSGLALETSVQTRASQTSVNAIPTNPLLATDTRLNNLDATISSRGTLTAPQVRTELSTELGRIDVAVSSRLATSGYTAPANADIVAIKAKTDTLVNAPTVADIEASTVLAKEATVASKASQSSVNALGTPLQASAYVAPDNTKIAEIKTKVDTLQNTDLTAVNSGIADIKGTGFDATKHNLVKIKQQASLAAALSA